MLFLWTDHLFVINLFPCHFRFCLRFPIDFEVITFGKGGGRSCFNQALQCIYLNFVPPFISSSSFITSHPIRHITVSMTLSLTSRSLWTLSSPPIWLLRKSGAVLHSYWLRRLSCQSTAQIMLLRSRKVYSTYTKSMEVLWLKKAFLLVGTCGFVVLQPMGGGGVACREV